jgi:predicted Fe-S protein YdhL (DUF1289 family)
MQTPCVHICAVDPRTGLCAGCGRTLDEIARWVAMTDDERRCIMLALPDRQKEATPDAGR